MVYIYKLILYLLFTSHGTIAFIHSDIVRIPYVMPQTDIRDVKDFTGVVGMIYPYAMPQTDVTDITKVMPACV